MAIIEAADGTRMRWEANNKRSLARLTVDTRYVDPDIEFRMPLPPNVGYFPNRSMELKFSTNDEARITLIPHEEVVIDPAAGDAVAAVVNTWERYVRADNVISQTDALLPLNSAMGDLAFWVNSEKIEER